MKILLLFIIIIHGLIHLIGFAKAFNPAGVHQLTGTISKTSGLIWLTTALLFGVVFLLILLKKDSWWIIAAAAVLLSQILIIQNWNDAKAGTAANLIILIPVIFSIINSLPSSYINIYKNEVKKRLINIEDNTTVTEKEIQHLPEPVKKYLRFTGSIGKPAIKNFRINFEGSMRRDLSSEWMNISSKQYNFINNPARLFYIKSSIYGIPFDGLHAYVDNSAVMQIKVASILQIVDARGDKMNQSENVTLFNDICLLAPSALINENIKWEPVDALTAIGRFTHNGITVSATLHFNEKGELKNFVSDDRFLSADGKTYHNYRWSTPVYEYKDIDGRKITAYAEAVWSMPDGDFTYAKFRVEEAEYNCTELKT